MPRRIQKSKLLPSTHGMNRSAAPFAPDLALSTGKQIVWAQLRDRIVSALEQHPEAREALVEKLVEDLGLTPETRIQS